MCPKLNPVFISYSASPSVFPMSINSTIIQAMANLDRVLKSRDNTLLTQVQILKAMVFPVVMNRCESWAIKKAEC